MTLPIPAIFGSVGNFLKTRRYWDEVSHVFSLRAGSFIMQPLHDNGTNLNPSLRHWLEAGCSPTDFPEGYTAVESARAFNAAHHPHLNVPRDVMDGAVIHRVEPEYPFLARQMHIQGTVLLHAVIGEDGMIHDLQALCGAPQLVGASLAALRQWRYRPYMKDGVPVGVETTIKVQFRM